MSFASRLISRFSTAILATLAMVCFCAFMLVDCGPSIPRRDGGVSYTPSSWISAFRTAISTTRWASPAARMIVDAAVPAIVRGPIDLAFDVLDGATQVASTALDAYESGGGDSCVLHAAIGGVRAAIVSLAQELSSHGGFAVGIVLERVADSAAGVLDELAGVCMVDAGWSSAGRASNEEFRAIEIHAASRGVSLRRDLDSIRPADR